MGSYGVTQNVTSRVWSVFDRKYRKRDLNVEVELLSTIFYYGRAF